AVAYAVCSRMVDLYLEVAGHVERDLERAEESATTGGRVRESPDVPTPTPDPTGTTAAPEVTDSSPDPTLSAPAPTPPTTPPTSADTSGTGSPEPIG
ncbi:hypothetical protein AB0I76_30650, partial [Micromonospora sp. NPDC049799]